MVNMFTHTVNMGVGDVAMGFFVDEADDKPTGGIIFATSSFGTPRSSSTDVNFIF